MRRCLTIAALAFATLPMAEHNARAETSDAVTRGGYVFAAAGCAGCHTPKADRDAKIVGAGGRALKTPFGTFNSPNITPDAETGIGSWSLGDFRRALTEGRAPDGAAYFPVFPYTSYTGMTEGDISDLWAYIKTLPAISRANRPHDVPPPFGWRLGARIWQAVFFVPGHNRTDDRGDYLVNVLGHCGECHTPRDRLGVMEDAHPLAGTATGPHGGSVPNITPDEASGIGKWSKGDLKTLFTLGMMPSLDFAGDGMGEVVENTTSKWTEADRNAVIAYLKSIPAIRNNALVKKAKKPQEKNPWD